MYSIGSVVEINYASALKRARKIYKGRNVKIKLYAKNYPKKNRNIYNVYSPRGISQEDRLMLSKKEKATRK